MKRIVIICLFTLIAVSACNTAEFEAKQKRIIDSVSECKFETGETLNSFIERSLILAMQAGNHEVVVGWVTYPDYVRKGHTVVYIWKENGVEKKAEWLITDSGLKSQNQAALLFSKSISVLPCHL